MELSNDFIEAMRWVSQLHASQIRKLDGSPYVSHLLGVAALVIEYKGTTAEATAALLHDSVEDQAGHPLWKEAQSVFRQEAMDHFAILDRKFGSEVTWIVRACTMRKTYKGLAEPELSEEVKKCRLAYLNQVVEAGPSSALVSICDKIHNARSVLRGMTAQSREKVWAIFKGSARANVDFFHDAASKYRRAFPDEDRIRQSSLELTTLAEYLERHLPIPS
jgi:(p)ppGpp synthase/HD superfamily hydrolase